MDEEQRRQLVEDLDQVTDLGGLREAVEKAGGQFELYDARAERRAALSEAQALLITKIEAGLITRGADAKAFQADLTAAEEVDPATAEKILVEIGRALVVFDHLTADAQNDVRFVLRDLPEEVIWAGADHLNEASAPGLVEVFGHVDMYRRAPAPMRLYPHDEEKFLTWIEHVLACVALQVFDHVRAGMQSRFIPVNVEGVEELGEALDVDLVNVIPEIQRQVHGTVVPVPATWPWWMTWRTEGGAAADAVIAMYELMLDVPTQMLPVEESDYSIAVGTERLRRVSGDV